MYRKIISNGDLIQLQASWFGYGPWKMHRNLSEECRLLQEHEDKARAKYSDLVYKNIVASTNIAEELETLQIMLLENSDAYFEVNVDNSILEKREGIKYNFNRGHSGNNNKQGASSNKDKQGGSNNSGGNNNQGGNNGGGNQKQKVFSVTDLLAAKLVLH